LRNERSINGKLTSRVNTLNFLVVELWVSDDLAGPEGAENGVSWSRFHSTLRFQTPDVKVVRIYCAFKPSIIFKRYGPILLDGAWSMLDSAQTVHCEQVIL